MSVTLPSVDAFYSAWGEEADTTDDQRAGSFLELAADLLWMATGLEDDPTDPRMYNLVQWAIMDMAIYLYVDRDVINENYSPFAGERIGSYSYTKPFPGRYARVAQAVAINTPTGVSIFDRVVDELNDSANYDNYTVSGQKVFAEQYLPLQWEVYGPFRHANQDEWPSV